MKKFRFITALVLVLGLLVSMPFAAQAEETEYREIYLEAAYKVSDTQILFQFSEPVKINTKNPWVDVRLTNTSGSIIGKYDAAGNRVAYYQWSANIQYFDAEHDKILLTMTADVYGCGTFTEMLSGKGQFDEDPVKNAAIEEKIQKGTYRFLAGLEETYLVNKNEFMADGALKNLCAESDDSVFVWPTRLSAGEAVHAWIDELKPLPANIVNDPNKYESMGGKGQQWDFDVISLGTPLETEDEAPVEIVTVVKNDPMMIAIIMGAGVVVAAVLVVVFILASKKRKAA